MFSVTSEEPTTFDPFAEGAVETVCATTESQREVWLADRLSPEASLAFNESVELTLHGALDAAALRTAVGRLVARHPALRATIGPDGTDMLIGAPGAVDVPLLDWSAMDPAERQQRLQAARDRSVETRFDLEHGPLFRAALYTLGADDHLLLMTAHHIVCDGWSWGVLCADLGALYDEQLGLAPEPDAAGSFVDYAAWETAQAASPEMGAHVAFWLDRFGRGTLPVLDLPTDRRRPPVRSFAARRVDHLLDAGLVADLRQFAARSGGSLFAALLAGFAATLQRLTTQDDIVIGIPAAGQAASEMSGVVGHCVNLLPLRIAVDAQEPLAALVARTSGVVLDALDHQALTYGSLLRQLPLQRDPQRLPLVSVAFNLDSAATGGSETFDGLQVALKSVARHAENFELFVNAVPENGGLRLECQYSTALFDAATVARWLAIYDTLLRSAVHSNAEPLGRLAALPAAELAALHALQPAPTPLPDIPSMHGLVERQCAATPQRIALRFEGQALTFEALDAHANRIARLLRERGIGRGQRVGLCLPRGVEMVAALLGVLKSGAAYVPLDPGFPQARLDYYADDATLALLLTHASVPHAPRGWHADAAAHTLHIDLAELAATQSGAPLPPSARDAGPDDTAYVIYTSGSTGRPKGVCLPHRGVVNFLASMARAPGMTAQDKLVAVTTLSFDIAVLELVLPLVVGGEVTIATRDTAMDGNQLAALIDVAGATMMFATPGMWRMLMDADWPGRPGFKVLVGGEGLPVDLAQQLLARCGEVWNMYGPTETTICSTLWPVDGQALQTSGVAIGLPVENTSVWILDPQGGPCPQGVMGEICIGGAGVASGYLDRPELTAERFVTAPDLLRERGLLYRTGDRGRWRTDGLLEHGGRLDFQVKVRGYRIELGEVEACCAASGAIGQSVAAVREDQPGDTRLVVYVTAPAGGVFDEAALLRHLRGQLAEYMVPQHVVLLERLPLTPNGKVDRHALPAPNLSAGIGARERIAPRNDVERVVLDCMEQVLKLPGLSVQDDFFALGGHSLLAARLTTQLNRRFELDLRLPTLFESPTAERLAIVIERRRAQAVPRREPIVAEPGRRRALLTPMQDRVRFVQEMHPDRLLYNAPSAHRLTGPLDRAKFHDALQQMAQRQPSLRTYIDFDSGIDAHVQCIADSVEIDLPYDDLTTIPPEQRESEVQRRMQAIVDEPMDIHAAPMWKVALYKLAPDEHMFLFLVHHLVWDGFSFDVLYDEMSALYGALERGRPHGLQPLAVTYGDYAEWYLRWLAGPECAAQLAYWKQRFAAAPPVVAPRSDKPRSAGMSGTGGTEQVQLGSALTDALRQVARRHDLTLNMLMFGLYAVMMADVIHTTSVVVAVPVRGRMLTELEPVMGFFNNLLAVQVAVAADRPLASFLGDVKQQLLEVMNHQDAPFERVAAEPEVASRAQGVGLYQALFSFQDTRERQRDWGSLRHALVPLFQKGATDDLGLWLLDAPGGLQGGFIYNADIYTARTAQGFHERFVAMLNLVVADADVTLRQLAAAALARSTIDLHHLAHDSAPPAAEPTPQPAGLAAPPKDAAPAAALSADEASMAGIWAALLHVDAAQIRASDNFFDLGGDSLLAMRAVEQSAAALRFRVEARRYVFESLGQLASREAAAAVQATAAPERLLGRMLSAWRRKG